MVRRTQLREIMMKKTGMEYNIFNFSLRIILLIIFIFTDIGYVVPAKYPTLSYPALRPLAYRNSESGPILLGDSRDRDIGTEPDNGEKKPPELSDEDALSVARYHYLKNDLHDLAIASDILLAYIYSGDRDLQRGAADILRTRDNLFVIQEDPKEAHKPGRTDYPAGTVPTKEIFENNVRAGLVKPVVIVNIKRVYLKVELAYAEEMRRISRYYNGNVTFILKVEEPSPPCDLPGMTKALYDTMKILGRDFYKSFTVQIPDGGFKTRLGPISLRYHKEGLIPYYREISELQEVFTRAGRMIMQMPNKGVGDHIICGSDTLLEPTTFHLDRSANRTLQLPAVRKPKTILDQDIDVALLLSINGKPKARIDGITPEKVKEMLREHKAASIDALYCIAVWNKKSLAEYMKLAYATYMEDDRPMAYAPINMHGEFTRSVFHTSEEWRQYYYDNDITKMTIEDWTGLRELALEFLGEKAGRVNFVIGKARDEGRLKQLIARFGKPFRPLNRVKRDPGVLLVNASEAGLDHVVIRGKKGAVIFGGPDAKLRNVIIDLEENEYLYIPDGWIIKDSYIGKNTFEKDGGVLIGATLYKEGKLHPLRKKVFRTNTCNSVVSRLDKEAVFISADLNNPTAIKVGRKEYKFEELHWQIDAAENRRALYLLQETIAQEFEHIPSIFPLNIEACKDLTTYPIDRRIHDLAVEIIGRQQEQGGGQHDVYIEGIQGTGKTTFFAKRLTQSLRAQGENVVLLHENWFHKSRKERDKLRRENPEEWKRHSISWHRWDKLQRDFGRIRKIKRGRIVLEDLYRQSTGRCDLKKTVRIKEDTIFIHTGFYTQDMAKFYGQDIKDLTALSSRPSTRIYLGLSQRDSLEVKLKRDERWLDEKEIRFLDKEVYAPAFRKYIATYDPACHSDYVFRIDIEHPDTITEVMPHTRLWIERRPREETPPAIKNVVIFGAGAIGRGLFGWNFRRSGYRLFFVDADEELVDRLRERKRYEVVHLRTLPKYLVKKGAPKEDRHRHYIDKVTATSQNEIEEIGKWVFSADAICLAVPNDYLPRVCPFLGEWLERRVIIRGNKTPINIFLSTNRLNAAEYVRELIIEGVSWENRRPGNLERLFECIGVVETTAEGITRLGTEWERGINPSRVYGDSFTKIIADEKGFKGPIPDIIGMRLAKDIRTDIKREKQKRLFLFGSAYSFVAYLGYLKGYTYIDQAWDDPWIKNETEKLLRIASEALIGRGGLTPYERDLYVRDLKNRFTNKIFQDPVVRAARDPIRKLSSEERFVGLARLIEDTNVEQEGIIALAIAACLRYENPENKESGYLQAKIEIEGVEAVLRDICQIEPESRLGRLIIERYQQFEEFGVAYAGLTLVNPKPTKGTTHIVMGFDGVVVDTIPIFRKYFAYIYWKIVNGIADDDKREPTEEELSEGKRYFDEILDHHFVGKAIPDIIKLAQDKGIKPERLKSPDEYLAEYLGRRDSEINAILKTKPDSLLKPGIINLLAKLKKLKKQVYLLTTAELDRFKEMVKIFGLKKYFTDIIQVERPEERIEEIKTLMKRERMKPSHKQIKSSNIIFIDDNPPLINEVRKAFGEDLHIVAIRRWVGKNDRELYSSANFILDNFIPSRNKLSIFLKTKGLVVPKGFSFQKQAPVPTGPIDIRTLGSETKLTEQIDSAA